MDVREHLDLLQRYELGFYLAGREVGRQLAELVVAETGSKSPLVFRPLPQDDPKQRRPDISQAQAKLGWEPQVSLADGLKETVAYFRRTLDFKAELTPTTLLPARPPIPTHPPARFPAAPRNDTPDLWPPSSAL